MELINNSNVKNWIRKNLSRIEFKISSKESKIALNLLEDLVQFYFPPLHEGKKGEMYITNPQIHYNTINQTITQVP